MNLLVSWCLLGSTHIMCEVIAPLGQTDKLLFLRFQRPKLPLYSREQKWSCRVLRWQVQKVDVMSIEKSLELVDGVIELLPQHLHESSNLDDPITETGASGRLFVQLGRWD
jgi:hypothetical protein